MPCAAAAAPVLISVVAQSAGGKSKAYTLPPIEILLSELDMKQEIESLLATCDFCPNVTNAPKTEEDMTAILKVRRTCYACARCSCPSGCTEPGVTCTARCADSTSVQ